MHNIPPDSVQPQADTDTDAAPTLPSLSASQARVLGCLIEKEAITPDTYPLTVNAAQAAANQKTARDPVLALDPGEVQYALRQLEQLGLARQTFSSRAERYAHRAGEAWSLTGQQVALLGLLLLRGAQTVHELLARSERLARFEGVEDVNHHLQRLARRSPPLLQVLPRGSGQREERYVHLLCGPPDLAKYASREVAVHEHDDMDTASLTQRVQALEEEVIALRARLDALQPP